MLQKGREDHFGSARTTLVFRSTVRFFFKKGSMRKCHYGIGAFVHPINPDSQQERRAAKGSNRSKVFIFTSISQIAVINMHFCIEWGHSFPSPYDFIQVFFSFCRDAVKRGKQRGSEWIIYEGRSSKQGQRKGRPKQLIYPRLLVVTFAFTFTLQLKYWIPIGPLSQSNPSDKIS